MNDNRQCSKMKMICFVIWKNLQKMENQNIRRCTRCTRIRDGIRMRSRYRCEHPYCDRVFNCLGKLRRHVHTVHSIRAQIQEQRLHHSAISQPNSVQVNDLGVAVFADEGENTCVICLENRISVIAIPCNHISYCPDCVRKIISIAEEGETELECPQCRTSPCTFQRTYGP